MIAPIAFGLARRVTQSLYLSKWPDVGAAGEQGLTGRPETRQGGEAPQIWEVYYPAIMLSRAQLIEL
jgi:hypothetical protein